MSEAVKSFIAKNGRKATIRYPKHDDLEKLLDYINRLSKEDTFVTFSGEQLSLKEEQKFLKEVFKGIKLGDKVFLCCFIADKLIGVCSVDRNLENRKRARHIGKFGLSVAKDFRGEGVGYELAKTTIKEARGKMPNLRLIELEVYDINEPAKKLYKKLGFTEVGTMPEAVYWRGKYLGDTLMYLKCKSST